VNQHKIRTKLSISQAVDFLLIGRKVDDTEKLRAKFDARLQGAADGRWQDIFLSFFASLFPKAGERKS
jgi:hypothetical protein